MLTMQQPLQMDEAREQFIKPQPENCELLSDSSIDGFFNRRYNRKVYNCAHFVCEVWQSMTGENIAHKLAGFLQPPKDRRVNFGIRRQFERLERPQSPCIALMQRRRSAPHVGIYLRGRILHIHEMGVEFQPLDIASRGFEKIGFYK